MGALKFRGRPPINYAGSVKDVVNLTNSYAAAMMNLDTPIDSDFVDAIVAQSVFTWEGRNPSPALDLDGNFVATDLDLLSFLAPLAQRGAMIEFPHYEAHRATIKRANERRISTPSRFGPVVKLTSNQKFFSMSLCIVDNSVIVEDGTGREKAGAFRNFMVVAPDGRWHDGWSRIIFNPTAKENDFLTAKGLWTGNTVYFKNAVHPNRWQSVFGAPYLLLKMLIERLSTEYSYYAEAEKELAKKFQLPEGEVVSGAPSEPSGVLQAKQKVDGFEALIDVPEFEGTFPGIRDTPEGLLLAHRRAKEIKHTLKPRAQVIVRADELAYFLHGRGRVAPWMGSRAFREFTPPRGKNVWQQIVLSNDFSYRWRPTSFTDKVAIGFAA